MENNILVWGVITIIVILYELYKYYLGKKSGDTFEDIKVGALKNNDLKSLANDLSQNYSATKAKNCKKPLIASLDNSFKSIVSSYRILNSEYNKKSTLVQGAEWLLDNIHFIEKEYEDIKFNMPKKYFRELPVSTKGIFRGYPRVYNIAVEVVTHTEGRIEEGILEIFLRQYQQNTVLTTGELWALPIMLRIALLQNINKVCKMMVSTQEEREKANAFGDRILGAISNNSLEEELIKIKEENIVFSYHFTERLVKILRDNGVKNNSLDNWISDNLNAHEINREKIIVLSQRKEANYSVTIGNSINSLRTVESLNWKRIFEKNSKVEEVLRNDPVRVYENMNFNSRDHYRHIVEKIARQNNFAESYVAHKAMECAMEGQQEYEKHVGYYLIDEGIGCLYKKLNIKYRGLQRIKNSLKGRAVSFYYNSIILLVIMLISVFFIWSLNHDKNISLFRYIIAGIATLIPLSEVVISILNWSITHLVTPSILPKIEFRDSIPEKYSCAIIIPTIVSSGLRGKELVENMEKYYLGNKDPNAYFILLGDLKDSKSQSDESDKLILDTCIKEVETLNERYCKDGDKKFYFLCRHRMFNEKENLWLGWERKRGKIEEFNKLIRGSKNTTYSIFNDNIDKLLKVKYVITLDADTVLPRDTLKILVGAMAHPLNKPYINPEENRVLRGYGLMQPRISVATLSANKTYFSKIFSGETGIDIYTTAVSDVYQDLFGEGIFTGKGIYDVDVFNAMLSDKIPQNAVLSHDLLEGSYVRTALLTDVELIDGYPAYYNSSFKRLHRWVRGDWQLLPWLRKKSAINRLSKWKIFDNLRRSLIAPSMIILLVMSLSGILPDGTDKWYMAAFIALAAPILFDASEHVVTPMKGISLSGKIENCKMAFKQVFFIYVFLPFQSFLMIDAIVRTLYRLYISKRDLLQWQTAEEVEKTSGKTFKGYVASMWQGSAIAIFIGLISLLNDVRTFYIMVPSCVLWFLSPFIAFIISKEKKEHQNYITDDEKAIIRRIGRRTWAYFEDFVSDETNHLGVDNFQEWPPNGIAHRTSPTNMGMALISNIVALDMGYIGVSRALSRLENSINSMNSLEKYKGHFYNWYDTNSMKPLFPRYISTVDSGNLVGYLYTINESILEYINKPYLTENFVGLCDTIELAALELEEYPTKKYIHIKIHDEIKSSFNNIIKFKSLLLSLKERVIEVLQEDLQEDYWNKKLLTSIDELLLEMNQLFPWIDLMKSMEDCDAKESLYKVATEVNLKDIPEYLKVLKDRLKDKNDEIKNNLDISIKNVELLLKKALHIKKELHTLAEAMEFKFLFDKSRELFYIGYDLENNSNGNSYYDLLASESRITSFIAIARGEVPKTHWFRLSRALTLMGKRKGLVSWSGTMFEYYMPRLILKTYPDTLWSETYKSVLYSQVNYCKKRKLPFGISESAYYKFDINSNYQYKAFGIPGVGLKRGLEKDIVISPYSTIMALQENPAQSMMNINALIELGMEGKYGFYEAIDYTKDRIDSVKDYEIIKSYMIHHHGMSLLAIDNVLKNSILQERFHRMPIIKATELLLQEKVSKRIVYKTKGKFEAEELHIESQSMIPRKINTAKTNYPEVLLLSNKSYSTMITNSGSGYSVRKDAMIYRWREDFTSGKYGMYFYIKDMKNGEFFSSTYDPCKRNGDSYETVFYLDRAEFIRKDKDLITKTLVTVAPDDDSEVRTVIITNTSDEEKIIEVTSYCEVVLQHYDGDIVHPAFGNLFITTEYHEEENCIIASRRPRSEGSKHLYMMKTSVVEGETIGELQYETARVNFIGRGNDKASPRVMKSNLHLTNSQGAVIDPIISFRRNVIIKARESCKLHFILAVGDTEKEVLALARKYNNSYNIKNLYEVANKEAQIELKYLGIKSVQANLYQDLASKIIFLNSNLLSRGNYIKSISKGQPALWRYGISGDLPIVLAIVSKEEQGDIIRQIIDAHNYLHLKGLKFDLVIVNMEPVSYEQPLQKFIRELIDISHLRDKENQSGGVFSLNAATLPRDDFQLLKGISAFVIQGDMGVLANQLKDENSSEIEENEVPLLTKEENIIDYESNKLKLPEVNFYNGYGGFGNNGKSYFILLKNDINTPAPWINVISNGFFGFHVSESGSSYTWFKNSRENKITTWNNDWIIDPPSEVLYLRDEESGKLWTLTPKPIRDEEDYLIEHGFGYSTFTHDAAGILGEFTMFTPAENATKIMKVKLNNHSKRNRKLSLTYFAELALGVVKEHTYKKIITSIDDNDNFITGRNPYNLNFGNQYTFLKIIGGSGESFTGNRSEFLGIGGTLESPEALSYKDLSNFSGAAVDPCIAAMSKVELKTGEEVELVVLLGVEESYESIAATIEKFKDITRVNTSFEEMSTYWNSLLGTLQVKTPERSFDYMINGWLMYQTIVCRLWARTAFYQSGGAYGFRDQLQDVMPIAYLKPSITRKQIIYSASRQFEEGDVQHWWHPIVDSGIRTRFSDDLLWLPYTICDYIKNTGDYSILDEEIQYLKDEPLKEGEDERYSISPQSELKESLYYHCIRAIERSLKFGVHNIPLMGSGDWNDGMSTVGNKGKGESVWLGWFLFSILDDFKELCKYKNDADNLKRYTDMMRFIQDNLEKNAWDGHWYRRAYFDDGTPLGSYENEECKIDSLAQSWGVISKGADNSRRIEAMKSLYDNLVKEEDKIILLLTPPFSKSDLHPGYIKSYIPGVRENGGQYTHAATWVILALAQMGNGDEAMKLFNMINPINHSSTYEDSNIYKTEPYVMTADIYSVEPHVGRGGWSWYTGTSAWFYRVGIEGILGFKLIEGKGFKISPSVPKEWKDYSIEYKFKEAKYIINVSKGQEERIIFNEELLEGDLIPLYDKGEYVVEVTYKI